MVREKAGLLAKLTLTGGLLVSTLSAIPGCIGFQSYVKGREARPNEKFVEINEGQDIHYVERGKKDGRKIMLFPGLTRSVYDWKDVTLFLAKDYHVYAVDLPGFGDSDPVKGQKTVEDLVESVNIFLEKQNIDKAVFVGHSMGSDFIRAFYKAYPDKVEMLVSVSGYMKKGHTKQGGPDHTIMHIPVLNLLIEFLAKTTTGKRTIKRMLESVSYNDEWITQDAVEEAYRNLQSWKDFAVARNMAIHLRDLEFESEEGVLIVYISGEYDNLMKVTKNYPGMRRIRNVGHLPQIEEPEELARVINEVIQENLGVGAEQN